MEQLPGRHHVAFILGTGPDLPVDRLPELEGHLTVGINRLWQHDVASARLPPLFQRIFQLLRSS